MGFFSWKASDTNRAIRNQHTSEGATPCYVLIPKEFGGGFIYEDKYDGYGRFGGSDIYALVARWNKPELCKNDDGTWKDDDEIRDIGIGIACYDKDNANLKYPIKIVEEQCEYEAAKPSISDPGQGYF